MASLNLTDLTLFLVGGILLYLRDDILSLLLRDYKIKDNLELVFIDVRENGTQPLL